MKGTGLFISRMLMALYYHFVVVIKFLVITIFKDGMLRITNRIVSGKTKVYADTNRKINVILSLFIVISLSFIYIANLRNPGQSNDKVIKQIILAVIAYVFYVGIISAKPDEIKKFGLSLFIVMIPVLIITAFLMPPISGARRWIRLGGFTFQSSEFFKFSVIIVFALLLAQDVRKKQWEISNRRVFQNEKKSLFWINPNGFWIIILTIAAIIIIFLMPDLGSSSLILITLLIMYSIAPATKVRSKATNRTLLFAIALLIIIVIIGSATGFFGARSSRLFSFLNPFNIDAINTSDPAYQIRNGMQAITNGGILGSNVSFISEILPESDTDLILAVVGERTGLVGITIIIIMYIILASQLIKEALLASTNYAKLLIFGTMLLIIINVFYNIGGLIAAIPLTGVPLPFMSYGGTSLISNVIIIALAQNIIKNERGKNAKITNN
jgi:cell division protein FtsW (lipid II flippase)